MPTRIDLSAHASVRHLSVNKENVGCAYLGDLYIPIFSLDKQKIIRRFEVANQMAGVHFSPNNPQVVYAVDDSYGIHVFDVRADTKNKKRMNPECENHSVTCTAITADKDKIAVASSSFGGGILDVRGSRHREHYDHVISFFDPRKTNEPITTFHKRLKHGVTSMEYYVNGKFLLVGDAGGGIKCYDTQYRDEDNSIRWEKWARGPITQVGTINKRIVYAMSDRAEATVLVDNEKDPVETLFGCTVDSLDDTIERRSRAYYKKPEWCVGLIKGFNDDNPIIAVHGVENENFISWTPMNQMGVRQDKPLISYAGHTGAVKCMRATKELLLTGGEDGKVIVQIANNKHPKFGKDVLENHHPLTIRRSDIGSSEDVDTWEDKKGAEAATKPSTSSGTEPSTSSAGRESSVESSASAKRRSEKSASSSKKEKEKKVKKEDSTEDDEKRKKKEQREKEKAKEKEKRKEEKRQEEKRKIQKDKERKDKEKISKKEDEEKSKEKKKEPIASSSSVASSSSLDHSSIVADRLREIEREREKMLKAPLTEEQKKAYEEREKRRLAKSTETPEERAIRKQKEKEQRDKEKARNQEKEKLRDERKKKRHEERDGSGKPAKLPKTD